MACGSEVRGTNPASLLLPGYSVGSLISSDGSQLYTAGAPRFNHTGKVIVFTLKNSGNLTVLKALLGEQVQLPQIRLGPAGVAHQLIFSSFTRDFCRSVPILAASCWRWMWTVMDTPMSSWWQHLCTTARAGREGGFTSTA